MKTKYVGLIFECPLGLKSDKCVFKGLREMSIHKALDMWYNMKPGPQVKLLDKHKQCIGIAE